MHISETKMALCPFTFKMYASMKRGIPISRGPLHCQLYLHGHICIRTIQIHKCNQTNVSLQKKTWHKSWVGSSFWTQVLVNYFLKYKHHRKGVAVRWRSSELDALCNGEMNPCLIVFLVLVLLHAHGSCLCLSWVRKSWFYFVIWTQVPVRHSSSLMFFLLNTHQWAGQGRRPSPA